MPRAVLGAKWRQAPLIVRYLLLPRQAHIAVCDTCEATWETQEGLDCRWCAKRAQANAAFILKPPAPRGYGYATPEDLAHLGINPDADRQRDLEQWRHDLELAVETGLITQQQGETAWQSANKNPNPSSTSSTSSTGKTSTTAPSTTKTPSSTTSRSAAGGPPSSPRPKQANRRSSSDSQWKPQKPG